MVTDGDRTPENASESYKSSRSFQKDTEQRERERERKRELIILSKLVSGRVLIGHRIHNKLKVKFYKTAINTDMMYGQKNIVPLRKIMLKKISVAK